MGSSGMGNALVSGMLNKSKSSKHPANIGSKITVNKMDSVKTDGVAKRKHKKSKVD